LIRSFPRRGVAGDALTTRPDFADTNLPTTVLRLTWLLLAAFLVRVLAAFAFFLVDFGDFDLEAFDAFDLLALVVTFFGIIFPYHFFPLPRVFLFIVSTIAVDFLFLAFATGINSPVLASRPILVVTFFLPPFLLTITLSFLS
jgi:hypothetical protein